MAQFSHFAVVKRLGIRILKAIGRLPMWWLYRISDVGFVVLSYVLRYRRGVITANLQRSFPMASPAWIARTRQAFYRHLADLAVETLHLSGMSAEEVMRRMTMSERFEQIARELSDNNQTFMIMLGHFGNWEWGPAFTSLHPAVAHQMHIVYKPIRDPDFNAYMQELRTRHGGTMVPMKAAPRLVMGGRLPQPSCIVMNADQSPPKRHAHWLPFLNQPTAWIRGSAELAARADLPVVYVSGQKQRRGHYLIDASWIRPPRRKATAETILKVYTHKLEEDIRRMPAYWLWSHRRWKHTPPADAPARPEDSPTKSDR